MPSISLDLIDPPEQNVRRIAASPEADDSLRSSIAELGVLQPVLVIASGERFQLIDGERRVRMARALELEAIPAELAPAAEEWWATAAGAAANMVRAPMAPLDTWRVMARLQTQNYTLQGACSALGLSERQGRKLDRLSKLHPDVLARLEAGDWPADRELAIIAGAKPADQARALKGKTHKGETDWHGVQFTLREQRIPAAWALFDIAKSKVVFEEDLFAQPGDEGAQFTTDGAGFMKAQKAALEAIMATSPKGVTYAAADLDQYGRLKLPKGAEQQWNADWRKAKKGQTVYFETRKTGEVVGTVVAVPPPAAKKPKSGKAAKPAKAADDADAGEPGETPIAAPEEPSAGITRAGLEMISQAKTKALRDNLRTLTIDEVPISKALQLMLLTITASNIQIGYRDPEYHEQWRELHSRLVSPFGMLLLLDDTQLVEIACDVMAMVLSIDMPGAANTYLTRSGSVAEWIGHATNAGQALPRFDTEAFLATMQSGPLTTLAKQMELKPAKKLAGLRLQLAGHAPDWRPPQTQFGAEGPKAKGDE